MTGCEAVFLTEVRDSRAPSQKLLEVGFRACEVARRVMLSLDTESETGPFLQRLPRYLCNRARSTETQLQEYSLGLPTGSALSVLQKQLGKIEILPWRLKARLPWLLFLGKPQRQSSSSKLSAPKAQKKDLITTFNSRQFNCVAHWSTDAILVVRWSRLHSIHTCKNTNDHYFPFTI